MGTVVSTCSATSSLSLWLPWLLARLLCLWSLATSPDLPLALLLPLPGGLHRLPTLASLLTMWVRGKLLYLSPLAMFLDWSLDLRLPDSGGQTSSFGLSNRLIMWAREKQLRCPLVFLLLPALDIPTARMRRPRITTTCHSRTTN